MSHITIKQRGQEPRPRRCHADASLFTCPFCSPDVCKPRQYHQIMAHIAGHKLRAVEYGDHVIYSCNICCDKMARHFHCCQCPKTYINKAALKKHLCNSHPIACTLKPQTVSDPLKDPPSQQPTSQPQQDPPSKQPTSQPQQDPPSKQPTSQPQQDPPSKQPTSQPQQDPPSQQPTSQPQQYPPSQPQQYPPSQQPTSQPQQYPPSQPQQYPPSQQPTSQPQQYPPSQPQQDPPSKQPASHPLQLAAPPAIKRRQISVQCSRRHITIKQRGQEPRPRRCHADASLFTCPFCSSDVCKPRQYHQIMAHIAGHKLRAVEYGDHVIYSCNICCGKTARHFHCCQCPKTYINKAALKKHLCNSHPIACTLKPQTVSDPRQDPPSQQPTSQPQQDPPSKQPTSQQQDPPSQQPTSQPQQDPPSKQPTSQPQQDPPSQPQQDSPSKQPTSQPQQDPPSQPQQDPPSQPQQDPPSQPQQDPPSKQPTSQPQQDPPLQQRNQSLIIQHITIKQRGQEPRPRRCHADASLLTCPFCSPDVCKPRQYHQIMAHIAGHKLRAVEYGDHVIYSCNICCGKTARHFHCCQCPKTYINKAALKKHLCNSHPIACTLKPQTVSDPLKDPPSQQPTSQQQQDPPSKQPTNQPQQDPPSKQPTSQQQDPPFKQPASQPQQDPPSKQPTNQPQQDPPSKQPTNQPQQDPPIKQPTSQQQDPPFKQPASHPLQLAAPPAIKRRQISVQCSRRHITIKQRGQEPRPRRCHADASLFTCPFCSSDVCKPRKYKQIMAHIVRHKLRAVEYGDDVIYSCCSCGEKARHFHCCQCPQTYFNQGALRRHLYSTHPIEPQPVDPPLQEPPLQKPAPLPVDLAAQPVIAQRKQISVQCPHCRVSLNSKNVKIHIKRKHHEAMYPITSP